MSKVQLVAASTDVKSYLDDQRRDQVIRLTDGSDIAQTKWRFVGNTPMSDSLRGDEVVHSTSLFSGGEYEKSQEKKQRKEKRTMNLQQGCGILRSLLPLIAALAWVEHLALWPLDHEHIEVISTETL